MFMAKKVVIDPGHGGEDPGASANGIVEKDYTLKISQYMADRLTELGIENALTRDSDVSLDSTTRPKTAQSLFGTGSDVILVSNHINAGGGDGAEIIYALRNSDNLSSKIASEFIKSGQNVRKYYQRRLPSNSSKDYYYMLRETPNNESIIVEYGFLDSTGDDVNQIKNNWEELAEAVVRALANYIGVPYSAPEGTTGNYYTVKKGDTLYGIAREYGISVDELKRVNNLTSNTLTIGEVLVIPEIEESETPDENIYIVKSGDTLYSIANRYGMTVDELKALNNLTSNSLSIGQQLVVSDGNAATLDTYTVKSGDTLYSIANKYGLTVSELKSLNNLTSDILSIGQVLNVSNSGPSTPTNPSNTYTVKSGDSLYSIARKYGITVDALKNANGKTSNLLSIGEILVIPTTTSTSRTYTVQSGDSLWKIATNYGVSVNALKQANNLSSDLLSIGQVLVIP